MTAERRVENVPVCVYVFLLLLFPATSDPRVCLCLQQARCGYAIILMALFWCTECMPLAATALLPVVLFPMMGIMTAGEVQLSYTRLCFIHMHLYFLSL